MYAYPYDITIWEEITCESVAIFKRKEKSNSFEQILTATAVKPAAINIDFTRSYIERGLRQWLFAQLKQDIDLLPDTVLTEEFFYKSQDYIIRGLYGYLLSVQSRKSY